MVFLKMGLLCFPQKENADSYGSHQFLKLKYDGVKHHFAMKRPIENIKVRGRFLGVFILVIYQYFVGAIHIFFGLSMLLGIFSAASYSITPTVYSVYTLVYGCLTFVFTYFVWKGKRLGWIGTVTVSLFVIIVDTLALLSLFNVLGIPKIAGLGEIPYSLIIVIYLLQNHVRVKYGIQ